MTVSHVALSGAVTAATESRVARLLAIMVSVRERTVAASSTFQRRLHPAGTDGTEAIFGSGSSGSGRRSTAGQAGQAQLSRRAARPDQRFDSGIGFRHCS